MKVNNVTVIIIYLSQTDLCLREVIRLVGDFSIEVHFKISWNIENDVDALIHAFGPF
jgi:hypothetical protein